MADINGEYYIIVDGDHLTYRAKEQPEYGDLSWRLNGDEPLGKFKSPLMLIKQSYGTVKINQDYYYLAGGFSIFSKRFYEIINKFNPINIDYLLANIVIREKIYTDYYVLHIRNRIECMDKIKSKWIKNTCYDPQHDEPKREVERMQKLQLDEFKLNKISLDKRLIFELKDAVFDTLFHESIINEFEKMKPKGFRVMNLNEWEEDIDYDIDEEE